MAKFIPATNVVRLPNAAARKVQQPNCKEGREARAAYRRANRWPGEYLTPFEREGRQIVLIDRDLLARLLLSLETSPVRRDR